jgi:hypothetical protein
MLRFRPMMEMSTRRIIPAQELMTLLALFLLIVSNLISSLPDFGGGRSLVPSFNPIIPPSVDRTRIVTRIGIAIVRGKG